MSSETTFKITEEKESLEVARLYVQGNLDTDTSPELKKAMDVCFINGVRRIHIVLDEVPHMDSSGIATLVAGLRWSKTANNSFVLSGLTDAVRDMVVLSKLEHEFEILPGGTGQ
jgi:anti-sigma B factor antagonist